MTKTTFTDKDNGELLITRELDTTNIEKFNEEVRKVNAGKALEELGGHNAAQIPMILIEAWLTDNQFTMREFLAGEVDEQFYSWLNSEQMKPWMLTDNAFKVFEQLG